MNPENVIKREGFVTGRRTKGVKREPKFYQLPEGVTAQDLAPDQLAALKASGGIKQVSKPRETVTESTVETEVVDVAPEIEVVIPSPEADPEEVLEYLSSILKEQGAYLTDGLGNRVTLLEVNYEAPKSKGVQF